MNFKDKNKCNSLVPYCSVRSDHQYELYVKSTHICHHIYNFNIVDCDFKQPIHSFVSIMYCSARSKVMTNWSKLTMSCFHYAYYIYVLQLYRT